MLDWENVFATRSKRMRASEIRELLKPERPDIISFAGGIRSGSFPARRIPGSLARGDILRVQKPRSAAIFRFGRLQAAAHWLVGELAKIGIPARKTMCSSHRVRSRLSIIWASCFCRPPTQHHDCTDLSWRAAGFSTLTSPITICYINGNRTPNPMQRLPRKPWPVKFAYLPG